MLLRVTTAVAPERSGFERVVLGAMAAIFGGVALLGWFAPDVLFAPIGVEIGEPAGYAEVRAAYGGLFGACALVFVRALRRPELSGLAFRFGAMILAGFVFGRIYSLAVDGVPNALAFTALTAESVGLFSCLFVLRRRTARGGSST